MLCITSFMLMLLMYDVAMVCKYGEEAEHLLCVRFVRLFWLCCDAMFRGATRKWNVEISKDYMLL